MKTARYKKIILTSLILFISFFTFTSHLQAQSIAGVSAIPPRLEVKVKPGEHVTQEIKVRNNSDTEKTINVHVKDFIVEDSQGTPKQIDVIKEKQYSRWAASSWIQISERKFRLKPGEMKSLMLTVIAPDNATPGGHYAMVLHQLQNDTTLNTTGSTIETNVGTLVYVTIPGKMTESAQITDFTAPKFQEYGPIDFQSKILNLSDIHIAPIGDIKITNWLGGKTADLPLEHTNIFPLTTRELKNTLSQKWLFGRYKAQFVASYGVSNSNTLIATLYFWVIPWRLIILLITAIAIIAALIYVVRSNRPHPTTHDPEDFEHELEELKSKYKDLK